MDPELRPAELSNESRSSAGLSRKARISSGLSLVCIGLIALVVARAWSGEWLNQEASSTLRTLTATGFAAMAVGLLIALLGLLSRGRQRDRN